MKLRIVCISDTHGFHQGMLHSLPDGDILIHAGDCCKYGSIGDLQLYDDWIGSSPGAFSPGRTNILVAGNHDRCLEEYGSLAREQLTHSVYLENSGINIDGLHIYGSPVQPEFCDWAFNFSPQKREFYWSQIPENTDILITHCPPFGILDMTDRGEAVGCKVLRKRIAQLPNLKLHIFGHIHHSYGVAYTPGEILPSRPIRKSVVHINACICGEDYVPTHRPIVMDWVDGKVSVVGQK